MANRTDPLAAQLSGQDPQNLIEYITRQKIYDSRYWKETCFGLSVVDVLEKATMDEPAKIKAIQQREQFFTKYSMELIRDFEIEDVLRNRMDLIKGDSDNEDVVDNACVCLRRSVVVDENIHGLLFVVDNANRKHPVNRIVHDDLFVRLSLKNIR